jgi:hypothetical protein
MLLSTKTLENVDAVFRVHQLETSYKVKLSVLSLILCEFFGVEVANIIEAKFLHVDAFERLLDLHNSLRGLIGDNDDQAFEDSVIFIEWAVRSCTTTTDKGALEAALIRADHRHCFLWNLLKTRLRSLIHALSILGWK